MPATFITSPVGRIVMGSLYKPNDKDAEGKPLTIKNGPKTGQPRIQYFIALAIPKAGEDHWAKTEWGAQILQIGASNFPQAYQSPQFAWKIEDGDSQVPNQKGQKWADREGCAGHWIVKLSGGFAPKVYRMNGNDPVPETTPDFVKPGYYVQARFSADGNGSTQRPGVYLNLQMVALRGYGPEIVSGPDVADAGFGAAALPAGASAMPLAGALPPAPVAGVPALPIAPANIATAAGVPSLPVSAPVPISPNTQFLQVPPPNPTVAPVPQTGAVAVPSPGVTVPVPQTTTSPSSRMTAKAGGATYDQYVAGGWTEAMLIAQGFMNP